MAKFVHADVLDGGLNAIKNGSTKMLLVSGYVSGDSYATVVAAKLAEVAMASTDFSLATSGNNRTLTVAAKSATASASAGGTPDLHVVLTDGTSKVLVVTDETSNVAITSTGSVSFPSWVYSANQPT